MNIVTPWQPVVHPEPQTHWCITDVQDLSLDLAVTRLHWRARITVTQGDPVPEADTRMYEGIASYSATARTSRAQHCMRGMDASCSHAACMATTVPSPPTATHPEKSSQDGARGCDRLTNKPTSSLSGVGPIYAPPWWGLAVAYPCAVPAPQKSCVCGTSPFSSYYLPVSSEGIIVKLIPGRIIQDQVVVVT
jgi:hypothetical protein